MREVTPSVASPSRRLVTAGALGAVVVALSGCGIRLEDDAPRVPLVPTREPIDAEDALVRLLEAVQAAATAPLLTTDPLAPLLPPLHARQATVLHDALRQRGVPEDDLSTASASPTPTSTTPSPSASGTASPSASASGSTAVPPVVRTVAEVESAILAAGAGLAGAEAELRPTLVAVMGQADAAVQLAAPSPTATAPPTQATPTASPTASTSASPDEPPAWSTPSALVPLITATRRATFLLEVAAARSPKGVRAAWLRDITELQALTADLVDAAGEVAPPPDLGQTLPSPVTTPAQVLTLATEALSTLLATTGANLRPLTDADPGAAFASVPGWLGTVAAVAHRHGIRLTPFPGLA
ncbi:hypothetical protein LL946_00515 [Knoellia locipacati]|uniref:hypothetical protein n=1 Tax=Knoellia locipacati TaxID=882824 RepID=UPI0038500F04